MPATEYPALDNMPQGCTAIPPWTFEAIPVSVPYLGVDEAVVMQEPLVKMDWSTKQSEMFTGDDAYQIDEPGVSIGYDTEEENRVRLSWKQLAAATRNNTAQYHPSAREGIVALASQAADALREVPGIYAKYKPGGSVTYPVGERGGGTSQRAYPLSEDDAEISQAIEAPNVGALMMMRATDRARIRDAYHEAVYMLWCALYGKHQSLSFRDNKKAYETLQGGPVVLGEEPVFPEFDPGLLSPAAPVGIQPSVRPAAGIQPSVRPAAGIRPSAQPGRATFTPSVSADAPGRQTKSVSVGVNIGLGTILLAGGVWWLLTRKK